MLGCLEARALVQAELQDTSRARHSIFVGYLMRQLAFVFEEDAELWEVVGLCHDIDFFTTKADPTQHGLVAADRLRHVLPPVALKAIKAHDHRTGVVADSRLAEMLKVADALAVIDARLGRPLLSSVGAIAEPYDRLRTELRDRPYLVDIVHRYGTRHALSPGFLISLLLEGPSQ